MKIIFIDEPEWNRMWPSKYEIIKKYAGKIVVNKAIATKNRYAFFYDPFLLRVAVLTKNQYEMLAMSLRNPEVEDRTELPKIKEYIRNANLDEEQLDELSDFVASLIS